MDLETGLEDQRMVISSKTALLGSNPSITRRVADQLRARGLPVSAVTEAVDLGLGASAGRKRSIRKLRSRIK
eukprot:1292263-Pyramimonas_sp.AAC.1